MNNRDEIDSIGERIAEHAAHLDAATHRLLTDLRTFDQARGWSDQGFKSFGGWLAWRVGWDPITAREHVRVAIKLGGLPLIDDALRRGELSYSKVRAMTRVATPHNESVLLEQARYSTGAQLERICKKYASVQRHDEDVEPKDEEQRRYIRRTDTADGMVEIKAVLHPEEAALVWAALERVATERCRQAHPEPGASAESSNASVPQRCDGSERAECPAGESSSRTTQLGRSASAESSNAAGPQWRDGGLPVGESSCSTSGHSGGSASVESRAVTDLAESRARRASPKVVKPFDRAEALVALSQDVLRGTRRNRTPTDLVITVTADTLTGQGDAVDIGVISDGTCVSASAVRRLGCDCGVIDVVEDERGTPLSVGRKRRTIPGTMKRALLRRDHTCRFPGCNTRVFLEGHHIEHWADGGETKLANIVSLCSHHHRYVHEYGFTISLQDTYAGHENGVLFRDRRGRLVLDVPRPPTVLGSGWPVILDGNTHLGITSETSACGWDGSRIDYHACVDALVAVESGATT